MGHIRGSCREQALLFSKGAYASTYEAVMAVRLHNCCLEIVAAVLTNQYGCMVAAFDGGILPPFPYHVAFTLVKDMRYSLKRGRHPSER